jgi:CheY-like chemotaxis protein/HPt (histidine-containing phosphotransfer) domain-containing protein
MPILLVEDSAPNRLVATAILSKAGYRVEAVENGLQAVRAVKQNRYGLVLMDIAMPEMDGLEATRTIRALEGDSERVPIVAMTAGAFDEDRQRCFEAGMNDFVSKPVVRADLLKAVERWLEGAAESQTRRIRIAGAGTALLDDKVLHQLEEDVSADLLPGMVKAFIAEVRRRLPDIESAVEDGDMKSAASEAHALKGASGTFGASVLRAAALELEQAAIEGRADVLGARLSSLLGASRDTLEVMERRLEIESESGQRQTQGTHR